MGLRSLGACTIAAAVLTAGAAASDARVVVPRFSLSATIATTNDSVTLRVERPLRVPQTEIRLFLVPTRVAGAIRSRFDERLSFIGSVRSARHARMLFTVPPLEPGSYVLAYWCRGCLSREKRIGVQLSPTLRFSSPTGTGCPKTVPNGNVPPGAPSTLRFHGNGSLWALLPSDGIFFANSLDGWNVKLPWLARPGASGSLAVRYRMLGDPSPPLVAPAIFGSLGNYSGPSWASRMAFKPGCWQITGRLQDATLSFVAQVALGSRP
jgi:hypothetical protein